MEIISRRTLSVDAEMNLGEDISGTVGTLAAVASMVIGPVGLAVIGFTSFTSFAPYRGAMTRRPFPPNFVLSASSLSGASYIIFQEPSKSSRI